MIEPSQSDLLAKLIVADQSKIGAAPYRPRPKQVEIRVLENSCHAKDFLIWITFGPLLQQLA
ncbi:MAG TPA: hypothetical protein VK653_02100, partial [Xanthobacteraceae bacterium]|nr:hypothetical protein [Xanthobacteraceae bacterium]